MPSADAIMGEASSAAQALVGAALAREEAIRVITVVNFTPYEWKVVDGLRGLRGSPYPHWETAVQSLAAYDASGGGKSNDSHIHGSNYTVAGVQAGLGPGWQHFSGFAIFYCAKLQLNLVIGAGMKQYALLGQYSMYNRALALFLDGSEAQGDLDGAAKKWGLVLEWPNGSEAHELETALPERFGVSTGEHQTIKSDHLNVQWAAAEDTVFVIDTN